MTIPITVLTGFLGSGKTTLLNRLLRQGGLGDTLVLVNELGEIPLDHLLVRDVREDVLVLESGCVCCAVRGDLVRVLAEQYVAAARGGAALFSRVLVETTGLADPTPILATLTLSEMLRRGYHLASVVATFDASLGPRTLDAHAEAVKQVALADQVVLTKIDVTPREATRLAAARVRQLNPEAIVLQAARGEIRAAEVLAPASVAPRARAGRARGHDHGAPALDLRAPHAAHLDGVLSFSVRIEEPIEFRAFALWLSFATQMNGDRMLRVKGLLHVTEDDGPVVVQAVQHVVYPPCTLARWPSEDRASRVVVITRGMVPAEVDPIRVSLLAAVGATRRRPNVQGLDR